MALMRNMNAVYANIKDLFMQRESVVVSLFFIFALGAIHFLKFGSGDLLNSPNAVTLVQAKAAAQAVMNSIDVVMDNESAWTRDSTTCTVSYSTLGMSMTGTYAASDTNSIYYVLAIVFSKYTDAPTGYTVNGTARIAILSNLPTNAISGTITGSWSLSGGKVAAETWDVIANGAAAGSGSSMTLTKTIDCNGTSFDASTLSLVTS
jgi:hypothetical protein